MTQRVLLGRHLSAFPADDGRHLLLRVEDHISMHLLWRAVELLQTRIPLR